jgi:hypothetical protein
MVVKPYKKWYDNNREVVVAVSCVFCEGIIHGTGGKIICYDCHCKWQRKIPLRVLCDLGNHPSFQEYPSELLVWKRIADLRGAGVTKL